ncbi:MAG: nuclear transport factor 2 family protein [Candidatus Brocadia sp.]|nr:nuclear transport factor 2 family protein [Candidatus Brocadia sp.]
MRRKLPMANGLTPEQREARIKVVEEHMHAENAHDIHRIMATFGPHPTLTFNGMTFDGHASIRAFYEELGFGSPHGGFPDLRAEVLHQHVSEDTITVEVMLYGTHTQTWQGIPATGREIAVPACAVFLFDATGKLAGERVYCDGGLLLKQMGVLPDT